MGLFDKLKKQPKPVTLPEDHAPHVEVFRVVGEYYNLDSIKRAGDPCPEYRWSAKKILDAGLAKKTIFRCEYPREPVAVVIDPNSETEYSSVQVKLRGHVVGYIRDVDREHMKEILQFADIEHMEIDMAGGDFRWVDADGSAHSSTVTPTADLTVRYRVR